MSASKKTPVYQEELVGLREQMTSWLPEESLHLFDTNATQMGQDFVQPLKLAVGDTAPLFTLPNAVGQAVSLQDYLAKGPVVLTFYRGGWCPYCNLSLNAYQRILPEMHALGANLLAISPETPDHSLDTKQKNELAFEVLSDSQNQVTRQYVQVFENTEAVTAEARKLGFDFLAINDSDKAEVPVPGVFIIAPSGKVIFAKSEGGDYRNRVEPADILQALQQAAGK